MRRRKLAFLRGERPSASSTCWWFSAPPDPWYTSISFSQEGRSDFACLRPDEAVQFVPRVRISMSNRLYVGNLPFHATEHLLNTRFSECGEVVSVNVMINRMSGQSRGFGFVEMATAEGAQKALAELNGKD